MLSEWLVAFSVGVPALRAAGECFGIMVSPHSVNGGLGQPTRQNLHVYERRCSLSAFLSWQEHEELNAQVMLLEDDIGEDFTRRGYHSCTCVVRRGFKRKHRERATPELLSIVYTSNAERWSRP
jgi:hypothetical protein